MPSVSIALVDANKLFREGLKALFTDRDFQVTQEASSLDQALTMGSASETPQLVLIESEGLGEVAHVVKALKASYPDARLVLLTRQLDTGVIAQALQAGADSVLMKDMSMAGLAQSLHLVLMGEKVFPTHLATLLINGRVSANDRSDIPAVGKELSPREVQILRYLLKGDRNKVIGHALGISEATIKVHVKSLLRKINASNRTQAAIWGLNHGFGDGTDGHLAVA